MAEREATVEAEDEAASEYELEEEFADHTTSIRTSEEIPGVYGHGVVREVVPGEEVDEFHIEMPDTTTQTITLDSQPSTQVSRTYSFFEWIDIRPHHQLEAIGARVPCVYDGGEWLPVFPARNRRLDHLKFRAVPWLYRFGIHEFKHHVGDEHRDAPRFELSWVPFMLVFAAFAWVLWSAIPIFWPFAAIIALFGGFFLTVLLVAERVSIDTATIDIYDKGSPAHDPPEWLLGDDDEDGDDEDSDGDGGEGSTADADQ